MKPDEKSINMRAALDAMPVAAEPIRYNELKGSTNTFDGPPVDIAPPGVISELLKGSITFSPDKSNPCHCANCVVLQQEVSRLRLGNAAVIHDNQRLQHENIRLQRELITANETIRSFERKLGGEK